MLAWGLFTLLLVFALVLLVNEMSRQGRVFPATQDSAEQPLAGSGAAPGEDVSARTVKVYFASRNGDGLAPEQHTLRLTDHTVDNCRAVIRRIIEGPEEHAPAVPPTVRLRGLYLLNDGELVADFTSELLFDLEGGPDAEALLAYAIVNTVTQPELEGPRGGPVRSVRFLVDGAVPQADNDSPGNHFDFSAAVLPDPRWNQS